MRSVFLSWVIKSSFYYAFQFAKKNILKCCRKVIVFSGLAVRRGCRSGREHHVFTRTGGHPEGHGQIVFGVLACRYKVVVAQ